MSTQISISPVIKLEVNTTPITGGSAGQILFQTTGNTVGESANLFWNATNNRLGIGTNSPLSDIDISKNVGSNGSVWIRARNTNSGGEAAIAVVNDLYYAAFELFGSTFGSGISNNALFTTQSGVAYLGFATLGATNIGFRTNGAAIGQERLTIFGSSGNIGINTTTDAGFKLDVNGTSRLQGRITTTYNSSTTTGIVGAIGSGTDLFSLTHANEGYLLWLTSGFTTPNDYANGFGIGIGNPNSSNIKLIAGNITSTATAIRFLTNSVFMGSVGAGNTSFFRASPFTGFQYDSQGGWNFGIREAASSTYRIAITGSTGNVLINTTTDAGFRLDVNGTARVTGAMTIGNSVITGNFGNLTLSNNGIAGVVLTFSNNRWGTSDLAVFGTQGAHADASSQIEIRSTTRGFLPPRMTTAQKNAIATPAAGLMVYDTDLNRPCFYNGSSWITL